MSNDWIYDEKVLDVLVELDGIRPGDEIVFKRVHPKTGHLGWETGKVVVVEATYPKGSPQYQHGMNSISAPTPAYLHSWSGNTHSWSGNTPVPCSANGHFIARANILAWRRRHG